MVRSRSLLMLLATLASAVVAAEMADYNRGLDAIVTKVQANGNAPVNADTLVPEDYDPEVANESPSKLAAREVTSMLQQGKDEGDCRKLADDLCEEVKQNVQTFNEQIKGLPKGKQCKLEGMKLVKQTKGSLKKWKKEHESRLREVNRLEKGKVTWTYSLSEALEQAPDCDRFWNDKEYLRQKHAYQKAMDSSSQAKSKFDTLTIQLNAATSRAAAKRRQCECQVRAAYNNLYSTAIKNQAKDAKAYAKCKHMRCFLNHPKNMSKCQNLQIDTPKVKEFFKFAEGVPAKECKDEAQFKIKAEKCPQGLPNCGQGQQPIATRMQGRTGVEGEQCYTYRCPTESKAKLQASEGLEDENSSSEEEE